MRVNVVQRKETGQYRVKVTAKDTDTGRWVTKWVKGSFATQHEANARKIEIEANASRGNVFTLDRSTVGGYVLEWLDVRRAMGKIEASSASTYTVRLRGLLALIGHLPLATLSAADIQLAYSKLVASKGVQHAAIVHRVFQTAIKDAVKTGRLLADPFNRVEPPRAKKVRKQTTLSQDQVAALVATHKGTELGLLIELLAVSGMRIGEAAALQWGDIDFDKCRIRIQRNMAMLADGTGYIKAPKTEAGTRTVAVPKETMDLLAERRGGMAERVFPGAPTARIWTRRVTKAMQRAGLGQFSTHDLRHAHATFLLKQVPNPKLVAKRLGHSDVKITLGIYAHVFDGDDDELGGLAGGLIGKP